MRQDLFASEKAEMKLVWLRLLLRGRQDGCLVGDEDLTKHS